LRDFGKFPSIKLVTGEETRVTLASGDYAVNLHGV